MPSVASDIPAFLPMPKQPRPSSPSGDRQEGSFATLMESGSEQNRQTARRADDPGEAAKQNDAATPAGSADAPVAPRNEETMATPDLENSASVLASVLAPPAESAETPAAAETPHDVAPIPFVIVEAPGGDALIVPVIAVTPAAEPAKIEPDALVEKPIQAIDPTVTNTPVPQSSTAIPTPPEQAGNQAVAPQGDPVGGKAATHPTPQGPPESGQAASALAPESALTPEGEAETPDETPKTAQHDTGPVDTQPVKAKPRDIAAAQTDSKSPVELASKPEDFASVNRTGADSSQSFQTPTPAYAASATTPSPQTAPASTAQPVPLNALAVEIAAQARAGHSRFEIRLDPADLGRIDVRLDIDREGNVSSRLVIERAETYDLLRRDQSTLERALQQAGLKTSENAMEFALRDQGFAQRQDSGGSEHRGIKAIVEEVDVLPAEAANGYARLLGARGGIDIRV